MLDIRGRVVSFPIPDIGLPPASARTSLCQPEPHLDNYFRKYKKDERKDIFWDIRKPSPAKTDVFKHIAKTPAVLDNHAANSEQQIEFFIFGQICVSFCVFSLSMQQ